MAINKKIFISLIIQILFAVCIIIILFFAYDKNINLYIRLSNAFLVPGACLVSYGILSIIAYYELFDGLLFNISKIFSLFSHKNDNDKNDFHKYISEKREKRKKDFISRILPPLLIGIICIIISIIFSNISISNITNI